MLTPTEYRQLAERLKAARSAQEQADIAGQLRQATAELLAAPAAPEQPPIQHEPDAPGSASRDLPFNSSDLREGHTASFTLDEQGRVIACSSDSPYLAQSVRESFDQPFSKARLEQLGLPLAEDLESSEATGVEPELQLRHRLKITGPLIPMHISYLTEVLKELTTLHEKDALTDEEYKKAKQQVLGE